MTEETTEARQEPVFSDDPILEACHALLWGSDTTPEHLAAFVRDLMAKHAPKPAEDSESERMVDWLMNTRVEKLAGLLDPHLAPHRGGGGYLQTTLAFCGYKTFQHGHWSLFAGEGYGRSEGQTLVAAMAGIGSPVYHLTREIEAAEKHVIDLRLKLAAVAKGGAK